MFCASFFCYNYYMKKIKIQNQAKEPEALVPTDLQKVLKAAPW